MTILEEIIAHKRKEVAERKSLYPVKLLEKSVYFDTPCVSMRSYITDPNRSGIIAEIKRKSPSKGPINPYLSVEKVSIGYMQAGASALSILTDHTYFGGSNEDLTLARQMNYCPILRKEFIVDEYQVIEARAIGADAILLIAAADYPAELRKLAALAKSLGMEVLMEVHNQTELNRNLHEHLDMLGVNNRNLKDFTVDIQTSLDLAEHIPDAFIKVAESGLSQPEQLIKLQKVGFQGFLMGQRFMETSSPEKACAAFIQRLNKLRGEFSLNQS